MNERDKNKLLRTLKQSKKVKQMVKAGADIDPNKKFLFMKEKEFKKLDISRNKFGMTGRDKK